MPSIVSTTAGTRSRAEGFHHKRFIFLSEGVDAIPACADARMRVANVLLERGFESWRDLPGANPIALRGELPLLGGDRALLGRASKLQRTDSQRSWLRVRFSLLPVKPLTQQRPWPIGWTNRRK